MIVKKLYLENFRNIEKCELEFSPGVNIISGDNAQGKTNLVESIWLMTGCRSFRGTTENNLIRFGNSRLEADMEFYAAKRNQKIKFILMRQNSKDRRKKITVNGVEAESPKTLFESFRAVAFTPQDTEIVSGAPEIRRQFIDLCVSQIDPRAMSNLKKFNAVYKQKKAILNFLLENNIKSGNFQLDVWDKQLSECGAKLSYSRKSYIDILEKKSSEIYSKITGEREKLALRYISGIYPKDYEFMSGGSLKDDIEYYYKKVLDSRNDDIESGHIKYSSARDDMEILIDGRRAREFASQGQRKSAALSLRLAQAQILNEKTKDSPIIILDDVMAELDEGRQKFVYNIIKDMQVFITSCHTESIKESHGADIFEVKEGNIKRI